MEFENKPIQGFDDWKKTAENRYKRNPGHVRQVGGHAVTKDRIYAVCHPKSGVEYGRFTEEDNAGWLRVRIH